MQLFISPNSPYARKTRVTVLEKRLSDRVEMIVTDPFEPNAALRAANPLHKVPTLVTDNGQTLHDSRVICGYLDAVGSGPRLSPNGPDIWRHETAVSLCDGILDSLFAMVMERRRPKAQQAPEWQERRLTAINASCDMVETDLAPFEGPLTLAQIGLGVALSYLDFRTPDINWRTGRPRLAAWFDPFARRPSMQATQPPGK